MQLSTKARSRTSAATIAVLVALAVVPFLPISNRMEFMLAIAMVYAIAAVGIDIFSGYGGQLMFGGFGFVAIGAYVSAVLATGYGWNVWATLPPAVLVTAAVAYVVGQAMVRLPDLGTAMGTFFFAFVVVVLLRGRTLAPWTQGAQGIAVEPLSLAGYPLSLGTGLFLLALACLVCATAVAYRYANSRAGRALRLVKRSTTVAETLGIDATAHKLAAFVFAAMCAGLAGFVYAQAVGFLAPENFGGFESVHLLTMAIIGGLGSLAGPIVGALAFNVAGELTRSAAADREILFALLLLGSLIFFPGGIYGAVESLLSRLGLWFSREPVAPLPQGKPDRNPLDAMPQRYGARLTVRDLSVSFGGVKALENVNLVARAGTIHAVVGPNGAGKTTLLNCISGIQAHSGTIELGADALTGTRTILVRRRGVARTFQHPSLVADLDVVENVELGLYGDSPSSPFLDLLPTKGIRKRDAKARAAAIAALDLVGFPPARRHLSAGSLTLAEQKVVDICRAVAAARSLLLLDEPTAGLDEKEIEHIARLLRAINERTGLTIVVIAHHIGFIKAVADKISVLDFGRVMAEGPADELFSRPEVVAAFIGEGRHD
jgi:branched-chain amino acid transport system permease protein